MFLRGRDKHGVQRHVSFLHANNVVEHASVLRLGLGEQCGELVEFGFHCLVHCTKHRRRQVYAGKSVAWSIVTVLGLLYLGKRLKTTIITGDWIGGLALNRTLEAGYGLHSSLK